MHDTDNKDVSDMNDGRHLISRIVYPIGMTMSCIILLIICILALIDRKLVNRMTLRLIGAIAITNFIEHWAEYFPYRQLYILGSTKCEVIVGFRMFARTFYCFTQLAISYHLFRRVVQLKESSWKYELITWGVITAATIPFVVLYYFIGVFGDTELKGKCIPGNPVNEANNRLFSIIASLLNFTTIVVCIFVTIIGHRSLNQWIDHYAQTNLDSDFDQEKFKNEKTKLAQRSFLYPLTTCIVLPIETIYYFLIGCGLEIDELVSPMIVTSGLSGTLTAIIFFVDPALWHSASLAKERVKSWWNIKGNTNIEE